MAKNLWRFERREQPVVDTSRPQETAEGSPEVHSVGATLRECREERGEDLRYVAQMLRIRYPYLKAIEDGLVDELPGPTYAIGFVRTYAEHLGLDSKDLVLRFKAEVAGLNSRTDLNFPAPIPEGKIPSGAILLVGIVVAALIYGIWIYASSKGQPVSEVAPQTSSSTGSPLDQTPGAVESAVASAGQPSETTGPSDAAAVNTEITASEVVDKPAEDSTPDAQASEKTARVGEERKGKADVATAPAEKSQTSADETKEKKANDAPPPPPPTGATANAEASSRKTAAAGDAEADPARNEGGKVYGQENAGARIVLHAIADSWVEVRDKTTDELILTRVLFKGDRYRVPNRPGLSLLTGNAGGLRITVDGKDVSPVGAIGSVKRDVPLEPAQLKSTGRRVGGADRSATANTTGSTNR